MLKARPGEVSGMGCERDPPSCGSNPERSAAVTRVTSAVAMNCLCSDNGSGRRSVRGTRQLLLTWETMKQQRRDGKSCQS